MFEEVPWRQGVLAGLNRYDLLTATVFLLRALPLHAASVEVPSVVVYPNPNPVLRHAGTGQCGEDQTYWSSADHGDSKRIVHGHYGQAITDCFPPFVLNPCRQTGILFARQVDELSHMRHGQCHVADTFAMPVCAQSVLTGSSTRYFNQKRCGRRTSKHPVPPGDVGRDQSLRRR
jgi:hypothetical protein